MQSVVLDLAAGRRTAARFDGEPAGPSLRIGLEEIRRLGLRRTLRRLRSRRFDRCVVIVNDLRAQRRWPSVLALALATRASRRELIDPAGRRREVSWRSALFREIPFVARRTAVAALLRRRVRREVARLAPAKAMRAIRPSRIGFIRADLVPKLEAGGSVAHIRGVVDGFERLGRPVTFITPGEVAGMDRADRDVHTIGLDEQYRLLPEMPHLGYNLQLLPAAIRILRQCGADLVYHRHALGCYAAAAAARECGLPLVVEFNGSEVWIARHWGHALRHGELFAEIERRSVCAADLVVAVSEPLRDQLREAGVAEDRILVNPNGVDAERFDPDRLVGHREAVRSDLGVGPDDIVVGFVGTFGPWHGAEVLAEAAGRVSGPWAERLHYLFIGDGERRPAAEAIFRKSGRLARARFAGLVPQDEAPTLLAACDVCASPHVPNPDGSTFFGSPTKLFEYMASGRAIVASRLGQIGDVLEHGRNAWLVPPGDPESLAAGLVRLAGDPELMRRLGDAGRRDARDRHSWTAHVRRILDRLASPPGGGS